MEKVFKTQSAEETAQVARELAKTLKGGETLALVGNLGAGKTAFVQALAQTLGVEERVTSPTFVYMHVHELKNKTLKRLVHVDAYRGDAKTLLGIGLDEYLGDPETTVVIEWADRAEEILPAGTIFVRFLHAGGDVREIRLES